MRPGQRNAADIARFSLNYSGSTAGPRRPPHPRPCRHCRTRLWFRLCVTCAPAERARPRMLMTDAPAWDYIVVGGGTAGCVLANRLSADAGASVLRAGGRPARYLSVDPRADRVRQDDVPPGLQLAVQDRAGRRNERSRDLLAERAHAGRLELDQRPHLHPRPSRRLRSLGRARQHGLDATPTCSRTSASSSTTSAARANGTAPTARCGCPTSPRSTSSSKR